MLITTIIFALFCGCSASASPSDLPSISLQEAAGRVVIYLQSPGKKRLEVMRVEAPLRNVSAFWKPDGDLLISCIRCRPDAFVARKRPELRVITEISEHELGVVKWFNDAKGYGFLYWQHGGDVFVHFSQIQAAGFRSLQEGNLVHFDVRKDQKGPTAVNVTIVK
jgi:cold shock protein